MKLSCVFHWVHVGLLTAAPCVLGALCLPSCGDSFTGKEGTAGSGGTGSGGEPSAGTGGGGRGNGEAGDGNAPGEAGSGGGAGEAGAPEQGIGGDGMGGNAGGAPNPSGGQSGSPQGGIGGIGGGPATGVKAFDDFVAAAEGWTVTGDDETKTVKYSSTGGNPNGSISAEEATTGTLFFTAPQKYLGEASAYYGGEIRFDLKAAPTAGDFFAYADVELTSNLVTLAYDCTPNPTTAWQSYVVPLTEAGWKMTTITGAAVTAAQFKAVLANLTRVRIRGEYSNQVDIGYLDNVYLGSKSGAAPAL